jgi:hypothetical protein
MTKDERAKLIEQTIMDLGQCVAFGSNVDGPSFGWLRRSLATKVLEAFADKLTCRHVSQSWSCKCAICGAVIG